MITSRLNTLTLKSSPRKWIFILLLLLSAFLPGLTARQANAKSLAQRAQDERIYIPVVMVSKPPPAPTPEETFADLMRSHPDQRRTKLVQNARLMQVAEGKAADMAARAYFSHTNPDGIGPNYLVEQAGYDLPDWYCQDLSCNNIESIAGGYCTPEDAFKNLLASSGHRRHLLGESSFYAEQTDYGIGFIKDPGSPYTYYWVIITARH